MQELLTFVNILLTFVTLGFLFHLHQTTKKNDTAAQTAVKQIHARIDKIFTVDQPSENEATKEDPNLVDVTEDNMIPSDVKFQVEGGDTQTAPGFEEKK